MRDVLTELAAVLAARKSADPQASYVAGLYAKGLDAILKKIGEEATETVIAAKGTDRAAIIHELADLWFHTVILMVQKDIAPSEILSELERRFGVSGIDEKAQRSAKQRDK